MNDATGCWEWTSSRLPRGYGQFYFHGRSVIAHVLSYVMAGGDVTDAEVIRHWVCDNPPCVNPEHLRAGTQQQNIADAVSRGTLVPQDRTKSEWDEVFAGVEIAPSGRCSACHELKPRREFGRSSDGRPGGLQHYCRDCTRVYQRNRRRKIAFDRLHADDVSIVISAECIRRAA